MEIAAAAVSCALDKLDILGNLITREVTLLIELKGKVREMKSELEYIKRFLMKVWASTEEQDEQLKGWVEDVREAAYDIEDLLDDYNYPRMSVARLRKLAGGIQDFMKLLQGIKERRDRYASSWLDSLHRAGAGSCDLEDASLDIRGEEIVGIEDGMKKLTQALLEGGDDAKLKLISVVGMAGLGKTTLVKQVYDSEEVDELFKTKAWIRVSRSCDTDELLRSIIQEFPTSSGEAIVPETLKSMSGVKLRKKLRGLLQWMRYVIVLDDVWNIEVLSNIKNALTACGGVSGSRILVTTRMLNVKAYGDVYEVKPLPPKQAWELFKKAISPDLEGKYIGPKLHDFAQEIVKKCEGLPLLIVQLASLLKGKELNLIDEWKKAHRSLVPELASDLNLSRPMRLLAVSYNRLNPKLRSCFMHLGIFPEGQLIKRMKIIRIWIAEGLVEEKNSMTLEEVADGYLDQLVYHSVIQVEERSNYGRVKSYKVHPLMREFILLKSREQKFCLFSTRMHVEKTGNFRRLVIDHGNVHMKDLQKVSDLPRLRTVIAFLFDASVLTCFKKFKYLRALDLANTPIETLPESLTELIHLRYLSLENTRIKVISKKLSRLVKLEVLNLKGTFVCQLPSQILCLKRMRHLLVYKYGDTPVFNCMQATKLPTRIGLLTALQKLSLIDANGNSGIIKELGKLMQLRRLGLVGLRRKDGLAMCKSVVNMKYLRSFSVKAATAEEHLDLYRIQPDTAPQDLERLYLRGRLMNLPKWILSLRSLARLTLGWSGLNLKEDPFNILHELPSLSELTLLEAYTGEELYCEHWGNGKGFPNLKSLHLDGLHHLQTFFVINGAMPFLQKMSIRNCEHLQILPPCIGDLTALEELNLSNMPREFVNDIQTKKERGVMHIRSIYDCDSGTYIN